MRQSVGYCGVAVERVLLVTRACCDAHVAGWVLEPQHLLIAVLPISRLQYYYDSNNITLEGVRAVIIIVFHASRFCGCYHDNNITDTDTIGRLKKLEEKPRLPQFYTLQ